MNVRKAAYEAVMKKLEDELVSLNYKILRNKSEFKKLAQEQATMKRQRGVLCSLMRDLRGKEKGKK